MNTDIRSLSHSKWRCKYHIVFAPKYRRQVIYGKLKVDIGKLINNNEDSFHLHIHEMHGLILTNNTHATNKYND